MAAGKFCDDVLGIGGELKPAGGWAFDSSFLTVQIKRLYQKIRCRSYVNYFLREWLELF